MTSSFVSIAALATILVTLDAPSSAQAPSPRLGGVTREAIGQTRFKGGVDLVSLDVCVRDATGHFLPDLTPEDFLILENGKPQRPSFVMPSGALPLRAVLLIDRSASMDGAKLRRAVEAAELFGRSLGPDDRLGIGRKGGSGDARPAVPPARPRTRRRAGGRQRGDRALLRPDRNQSHGHRQCRRDPR